MDALPKIEMELVIAAALIAGALYLLKKGAAALSSPDAAAGVANSVVTLAGNVGTGTVLGIGDAIGIPRTDMTACQQAQAEGRWWDASFACPAGTFLSGAGSAAASSIKSLF